MKTDNLCLLCCACTPGGRHSLHLLKRWGGGTSQLTLCIGLKKIKYLTLWFNKKQKQKQQSYISLFHSHNFELVDDTHFY